MSSLYESPGIIIPMSTSMQGAEVRFPAKIDLESRKVMLRESVDSPPFEILHFEIRWRE